jgi:hypothetical protein
MFMKEKIVPSSTQRRADWSRYRSTQAVMVCKTPRLFEMTALTTSARDEVLGVASGSFNTPVCADPIAAFAAFSALNREE